ncbi:hypothetical protein EDB86DRAFT_2833647 [Lactarius hatsudake]|nr:hypothetical protein EDB86DRAFT_2833647 [Lactarius hatsudake]
MGKGGVGWWHAPFLRVWGGATKGVPGGVVPSCTPSWEGKGRGEREGGGGVPSYAPLLWEWAARPRGKGWDRRRRGPHAHPFHANGEGRRRGERRRHTLVPTPSVRMGREVPGREGEVGGADRGQGELGVTARRGSGVPTHVPSTRHGHGGKGGGDGVPSCAAFPPERGGTDRGAGEGKRRAETYPSAPLSALKWGSGQCGGKGRRGRGRLTPHAMKGKGWGVGLSSCVFSSTRMGRVTGTEGGREGERRGEEGGEWRGGMRRPTVCRFCTNQIGWHAHTIMWEWGGELGWRTLARTWDPVAEIKRACHGLFLPLHSPYPIRVEKGTQEGRPTSLHRTQRGAHEAPYSCGQRAHEGMFPPAPSCMHGKGARDPLPSPFARKGGHSSPPLPTPSLLSAPPRCPEDMSEEKGDVLKEGVGRQLDTRRMVQVLVADSTRRQEG